MFLVSDNLKVCFLADPFFPKFIRLNGFVGFLCIIDSANVKLTGRRLAGSVKRLVYYPQKQEYSSSSTT